MSLRVKPSARILITRTDRIGDLVVSTPVFKAVRERFPQAWIAALVFLENRELVEGNPYLNEVLLYDKKGSERGLWGNLVFAGKLRKKKFDLVIHLHATNRMHQITFLAGIPVRMGWTRKSAGLLTHGQKDIKSEGLKHEAEYNFELLKPLGIETPAAFETFVPVSDRAHKSLGELTAHLGIPEDKPWVVINPSSSCPSKMWPVSRFAELVDALGEQFAPVVMIIGGPKDKGLAEKMRLCSKYAGLFDLTGKLSLGMLSILLKKSNLLISNDSGPVHIASAVGTPVISIFGRNQPGLSPQRWRPLGKDARVIWKNVGCDPCLAHNCRIHFLCLDVISVEDVLREVRAMGDGVLESRRQESSV